jgi:hypothetical protein
MAVQLVAVHDQIALALRGLVDGLPTDLDGPECLAAVRACLDVVVSWYIDYLRATACVVKQCAKDVVVRPGPVEASSQALGIDDVPHQVDRCRSDLTQEIQQQFGLATWIAQVYVRNEQAAEAGVWLAQGLLSLTDRGECRATSLPPGCGRVKQLFQIM